MFDSDKRNWIVVLPIVGMGIGYLLLLGYMVWGRAPSLNAAVVSTSPPPPRASIDRWDAYEQVRAAAQAEAADAQPVSASAQWQAVSKEQLLDGASNWSFVFYSPADGSSLDVIASTEAAQVVNQTRVWVTPKVLDEGAWQAGPRDALLAFLAYGGQAFLDEHPQAVVNLHLAESSAGDPVWTIVALNPEDRSLLSTMIDANTGQILSLS